MCFSAAYLYTTGDLIVQCFPGREQQFHRVVYTHKQTHTHRHTHRHTQTYKHTQTHNRDCCPLSVCPLFVCPLSICVVTHRL